MRLNVLIEPKCLKIQESQDLLKILYRNAVNCEHQLSYKNWFINKISRTSKYPAFKIFQFKKYHC